MDLKPVISMDDMKVLHKAIQGLGERKSGTADMVRNSQGIMVSASQEIEAFMGTQNQLVLMSKTLIEKYEGCGDKANPTLISNSKAFLQRASLAVSRGQTISDSNYEKLACMAVTLAYNTMSIRRGWLIEQGYWSAEQLGMSDDEFTLAVRPSINVVDVTPRGQGSNG